MELELVWYDAWISIEKFESGVSGIEIAKMYAKERNPMQLLMLKKLCDSAAKTIWDT